MRIGGSFPPSFFEMQLGTNLVPAQIWLLAGQWYPSRVGLLKNKMHDGRPLLE